MRMECPLVLRDEIIMLWDYDDSSQMTIRALQAGRERLFLERLSRGEISLQQAPSLLRRDLRRLMKRKDSPTK